MKTPRSLVSALTHFVRPLCWSRGVVRTLLSGACAWGPTGPPGALVLRRICYASGMLELSIFGVVQRLLTRHALIRWANVGSLFFALGCGAPQKTHEAPKGPQASTAALTPMSLEEFVVATSSHLKEVMYDWSAEPVHATGLCAWAGVWRNWAGPPVDHALVSDVGIGVY